MRTLDIIGLVICCVLVTSCAMPVPVTKVVGSNGRPAYSLKCSGFGRDRQDCLKKAGELCPGGYDILDDNSRTNGALVTNNMIIAAHKEYLTISCR